MRQTQKALELEARLRRIWKFFDQRQWHGYGNKPEKATVTTVFIYPFFFSDNQCSKPLALEATWDANRKGVLILEHNANGEPV